MEKSEKSGGKRNQKNQKNKQKIEVKGSTNVKDEITKEPVREPEPQPQRANRRNRSDVTSNVPSEVASSPKVPEKKPEPKVEVDHSNLKRETEEIAKLTKKFSKREISSNWHRYSAPEDEHNDKAVEYEAPADFSDLIQVSASRGGHLQLKEEQDWSTVSGAELGGYFALDLKMLNQGLACIPAHERLRIPSHVLTEDDVKKFKNVAEQALICYKTEFSDPKNQTLNILTSLITSEEKIEDNIKSETSSVNIEESFNILDVETSRKKLLDLTLGPTVPFEEQQKDYSVSSNKVANPLDSNINEKTNNTISEKMAFEEPKPKRTQYRNDDMNKEVSLTSNHLVLSSPSSEFSEIDKENVMNQKVTISDELNVKEPNSYNHQNKKDTGTRPESKEEARKESKPSYTALNLNQTGQKMNSTMERLEEDDDLDFLLSLKAPVKIQRSVETSSVPVKEVSLLPSGNKVTQLAAVAQTSDLDDWLDSVLQD